jgi:hypothetical protein
MAMDLTAMPAEIQLHIFRFLLPQTLDALRGKDLANVRLTCKGLHAAATDVFFERHGLVLWIGYGTVYVPDSTLQLCKRPDLAVLVKSVWMAIAINVPERQPDDNEPCKWPYLDVQPHIEQLIEAQSGTNIRLAQPDWYKPVGSDGKGLSEHTVEMWLKNHLRMLPNAHHVRIVPPNRRRRSYIDQFLISLKTGLFQLPPACTTLDIDIKLLNNCPYNINEQPDDDADGHTEHDMNDNTENATRDHLYSPIERRYQPWIQVDTLRLRIEDAECSQDMVYGPGLRWAQLVNKFSRLTRLTLHRDFGSMNAENIRREWRPTGSIEDLCIDISLSHLRYLSISQWVLYRLDVESLRKNFPRLQELHMENLAFVVATNDMTMQLSSPFAFLARSMVGCYGGNCALTFGDGPFMEILDFETTDHDGYDDELNAIVIASLKTPTLDLVSDISRSAEFTQEAEDKYQELVEHKAPSATMDELDRLRNIDVRMSEDTPKEVHIETTGMDFVYFPELYSEEEKEKERERERVEANMFN